MTEEELEAAVEHDMRILEESWMEGGFAFDDDEGVSSVELEARLKFVEERMRALVEGLHARSIRWMLILISASTLVTLITVLLTRGHWTGG